MKRTTIGELERSTGPKFPVYRRASGEFCTFPWQGKQRAVVKVEEHWYFDEFSPIEDIDVTEEVDFIEWS